MMNRFAELKWAARDATPGSRVVNFTRTGEKQFAALFGNGHHLGATLPGAGYHGWQALLIELVLTLGLVSVILGTASAAQNVGAIAALGVGGYIALAGLWAAPVSGASMNSARSFGPALVSGDFHSYWVYVLGPLAGGVVAVCCGVILRGRGGDPISQAAGSGALGQAPARLGKRFRRGERDRSAPSPRGEKAGES